ncbi:MAG: hypothetical protein ACN6OP_03470 [Pseudomonadales bacterium]
MGVRHAQRRSGGRPATERHAGLPELPIGWQLAHRTSLPSAAEQPSEDKHEGALPPGWKLAERKTHFILTNGNDVVATMARPNAATYAAIFSAVIVKGAI